MTEGAFDIYHSGKGYVAVSNPVRRDILRALQEAPRQLPELMEITGKAKPTLSSIHMKDLLGQGLVTEEPHPTDSRRKVYRLTAERIGSSDVPVEALRQAVQNYVQASPQAARFPLAVTLRALAAAPEGGTDGAVRAQAEALGKEVGAIFAPKEVKALMMELVSFLDQEGLARPSRMDFDDRVVAFVPGRAFSKETSVERVSLLISCFVVGVLSALGLDGAEPRTQVDGKRFLIAWP